MTVRWKGDDYVRRMEQAARRGTFRAAEVLRAEMIRLITSGGRSGRWYGRHQASAPGEPPATDTGFLVGSIRVEYASGASGYGAARVVIGGPGLYLEYGTQKMEPRPFARPALANMRQDMMRAFTEEIEVEFR